MSNETIIPIILCGGSGTRLWPLSRESYPKQYLSLNKDNDLSLLQNTFQRISDLDNLFNPILICNEDHRFIVAEQMKEINVKPKTILLEPFGRNTAPAVTLSALLALEKEEDPILIVLSSDHIIENKDRFINVLKKGLHYARKDRLVTFGIVPKSPETGYGYIKSEEPFTKNIEGHNILEFIEKPNLENALKFASDKHFTWNSGMFMFKAKTIIEQIKEFSPEVLKHCERSLQDSKNDLDFQRINQNAFYECPNISIDVAVMEKTNIGTVIPLDAGWSDVGSWESIWNESNKDKEGNFSKGKVILEATRDSYIRSENRLIVGIGLDNLVVIETNDAILIANKSQTQKVKSVVKKLKDNQINEGQNHSKVYRPWGYYTSIEVGPRWQVKLISVKPGEKLSLQMHHHRSEHWVVVNGTAKVEVDNIEKIISENQSIYIPLGAKHRLTNPGKLPLVLVEVQSGSYVGEDDILRFEDKYGR